MKANPIESPPCPKWGEVDWIVIGSGAGGLAAAITAAAAGKRVAVFEKAATLGGSTAWSGGRLWLPGHALPGADQKNTAQAACTYLKQVMGSTLFDAQAEMIQAYLAGVPRALRFFCNGLKVPLRFAVDTSAPDFHDVPDASRTDRTLYARAFNVYRLGTRWRQVKAIRAPLWELTFFGLGVEAGRELAHFMRFHRSIVSFCYVAAAAMRYVVEWLLFGRSMRLVNGQALVAGLLAAGWAIEAHADASEPPFLGKARRFGTFVNHSAQRLIYRDGRVAGVVLQTPQGEREVGAREGVVLACGGFPHDEACMQQSLVPWPHGQAHFSAAPLENTGDGLRMAERAGAQASSTPVGVARAPVSVRRRMKGATAVYPHFVERAKPGVIAVNRQGRRICNEAQDYHGMVSDWLASVPPGATQDAWLICDRRFRYRYGLGATKPGLLPCWDLWTGYLRSSGSIEGLARQCGIEPAGLVAQVQAYNQALPADAFKRGASAFERSQGDVSVGPNPCLAPIHRPPYYAVRLQPGSIGTFVGLRTDTRARVLGPGHQPIAGLYACGNDMAPVFGGAYPSNGITLGAALVFGHLAVCEALKEAASIDRSAA
jgi:FAD binding domain